MTFCKSYQKPMRYAFAWVAFLALWCGFVLDMGESLYAFLCSLGGYAALLLLIILRRPTTPTKLDLLLVAWALPILFFAGTVLLPAVQELRGVH
jgi:hypothetical protein